MKHVAPIALSVGLLGLVGGVAYAQAFQPAEPKPQVQFVQPAAETATPSPTTTTATATPSPTTTTVAPKPVESTTTVAPKPAPKVQQKVATVSEPTSSSTPTPTPAQTTTQTNSTGITVITEVGADGGVRKRVPPPTSK